MIFGMVYGIGVYNIPVLRHVAPHFHPLRILARLRPSHYRWISLERIPPTDPAFTFKLDPRSRRCPKVWQCPGARWMVHIASARTYHRHGFVWDGEHGEKLDKPWENWGFPVLRQAHFSGTLGCANFSAQLKLCHLRHGPDKSWIRCDPLQLYPLRWKPWSRRSGPKGGP